MLTIQGHVVRADGGRGLPGLQVRALLSSESMGRAVGIGSDVTAPDGAFSMAADLTKSAKDGEGITLQIEVTGGNGEGVTLFESAPRTVLPTGRERYRIALTRSLLEEFDLPPAESAVEPDRVVAAIRTQARHAEQIEAEWADVARARVDRRRQAVDGFSETFRPALMSAISQAPSAVDGALRLVRDGEAERDVATLTRAAFLDGVERITDSETHVDESLRRVTYYLSDAQRDRLSTLLTDEGGENGILGSERIREILRLGEPAAGALPPSELRADAAEFDRFLQSTHAERCAEEALNPAEDAKGPNPGEGPGEGEDEDAGTGAADTGETVDAASPEGDQGPRIDALLAQALDGITAPMTGIRARPAQGDVTGNIQAFGLTPGPADVPAFFDFHQLSIAFDHVWKEFLDSRIEPLAQEAYLALQARGGQPQADADPIAALEREERLVASAQIAAPPAALYSQSIGLRRKPLPPELDHGALGPGELLGHDDIFENVYPPSEEPPPDPTPPPDDGDKGGLGFTPENAPDWNVVAPPPRTLIDRLRRILRGRYSFTAFGADNKTSAVNFGLAVTWRQRWEPVTYQVGELVRTITLAPGESRSYTKRTKITRKRAEKEVDKNTSIRQDEFTSTTRSEADIVRKAQAKTNFSLTAEGTYNFGIAKGDSTATTEHDAQKNSDEARKSFREAVVKASQEYRQEHTLEIAEETSFELEETETGEIRNDNLELTSTFLFFELQRRFRVTERIHKATPVVLVAQTLPRPNEIDEAFVIRHGWILKRALLDDSYAPVLTYVAGAMAGDRVARDALHAAMLDHRAVVMELKSDLYALKEQASEGYEALRRAVEARIASVEAENTDGFLEDLWESFAGGGESVETAQMREEAARNHEARAVEQVRETTMALQREISAFSEATKKYTDALRRHKEWELRIVDLLLHIKENVLHYMQAIWAYEHPDQRFLRLHMKPAPDFAEADGGSRYRHLGETGEVREHIGVDGTVTVRREVAFAFTPRLTVAPDARTLGEIADLDTLLGFKGNYLIFPLRESNALTDYMLAPYVDAGFRLMDPGAPETISRDSFAQYICHLRDTLSDEAFETLRPDLIARFRRLLLSDATNGDEIVVPSGSVYIEALPGAQPILEDFKLAHRAIDVRAAEEGARAAALENLRRAALILEEDFSDPDIDARYVFEGEGGATVVAPSPGPAGGEGGPQGGG